MNRYPIYFSICLASSLLLFNFILFVTAAQLGIPVETFLAEFTFDHACNYYNSCEVTEFLGLSTIKAHYFLFTVLALSNLVILLFIDIKRGVRFKLASSCWTIAICSAFLFTASIAIISRYKQFNTEKEIYQHLNHSASHLRRYPKIQSFISQTKNKLSRKHHAKFVTNQNLDGDPYMSLHRIVCYNLLPEVHIRTSSSYPEDAVVLMMVRNPLKYLKDNGYTLVSADPSYHYVLGIKKGAQW